MKKVLLTTLLLLLCVCMIVACGEAAENSGDENKEPGNTDTNVEEPGKEDEEKTETIKYGAYFISNAGTNKKLGYGEGAGKRYYTIDDSGENLITIYPVAECTDEQTYYICFGDDTEMRFLLENVSLNKEASVNGRKNNRTEQFVFEKQENGTYIIRSAFTDKTVLSVVDGKILNVERNPADKNQYWKLTATEYPQETYSQWISKKGDIYLRLPKDIVAQAKTTDERMQIWADDIQKTYDAYIELTGYTPYSAIIVQGSEKQGVMAGVVNGCNTIFINVEWYVDDVIKLQKRWEEGKRDFNFCILHEMGHMFDSDRGWNFESEMEADLKAVYVLYKHQKDDKYGAWAAPAEFSAKQCFNYDTITQAYDELGADMEVEYSFYGAAQLFTELAKETGWEALKKTFHHFQDNRLYQSSFENGGEIFNKFIEVYSMYTDVNIVQFIGPRAMKVLNEKFPVKK